MKIIQLETETIEMKKCQFENLSFSCMKKMNFLVIEPQSEDLSKCLVLIYKNKPVKLVDRWDDAKAEEFEIIAYVDLSEETAEKVEFLTNQVHSI